MVYLADLQLLNRKVHALDIGFKLHPSPLHVRLQSQDFAIDCESCLHALVDDSKHLLNGWSVMLLLRLIVFQLLRKYGWVRMLYSVLERFTQLPNAPIY